MKKIRVRAIIFHEDKLITMYREKDGRSYYSFPGGGLEDDESMESCVIRECKEEFGIDVKPLKELYIYENENFNSIEHFYLCRWVGGEFGTGDGEEFQTMEYGLYEPRMIKINEIEKLPVLPKEVSLEVYSKILAKEDLLNVDVKYFHIEK